MSTTTAPRSRRTVQEDFAGKAFNRLAATCLTIFALIWMVPFAWAVITSLRPNDEITANPVNFWSGSWTLDAYTNAWDANPIGWWYLNSFIISTLSVLFTVVVCSMIGFAMAHLQFRGKRVLLAVILAGIMLPMESLVLPQFMQFRALPYWAPTGRSSCRRSRRR